MARTGTQDLVNQGVAAARVGDADDARRLLREALKRNPGLVEAWLALAGVEDDLQQKRDCFRRVLAIDADNAEARAGLALVDHQLAFEHAHQDGTLVCYRHPETETGLRCNRCNRPICVKCAHRTPVGFRCPDCIREQQDKYYTGHNLDYVIAAVTAVPLSLIVAVLFSFVIARIGFFSWIIAFIAAPVAGGFIAEAVRRLVGRRRSRYLAHVVAGSLILATAPFLLLTLFSGSLFGLIVPAILLIAGSGAIMARLR
jgi:hypothetical protein